MKLLYFRTEDAYNEYINTSIKKQQISKPLITSDMNVAMSYKSLLLVNES